MSMMRLIKAWDKFWFEPKSASTVCLFRILFGLLVLEWCILLSPEFLNWFSDSGVVTSATAFKVTEQPWITIFKFMPCTDVFMICTFVALILFALLLTLGLFTRFSSIAVFILLLSFQHRNAIIFNSGDVLLRLMAFYLMLSPCGELFSLDRFIAIKLGKVDPNMPAKLHSPWAQRLMQIQMALVYFQAFWSKSDGASWIDGNALYYVLREREFLRFPIPILYDNYWLSRLATWYTLVIEFSLFTLVWLKELRYFIIFGGILLHIGIDWCMNLPVFQYLMIAGLLTFIEPEDMNKLLSFIKLKTNFQTQQFNKRAEETT